VKRKSFRIVRFLLVISTLYLSGCKGKEPAQEVVIYTSLDKVFSQPILEAFEKRTGIKVLPVYDSEATDGSWRDIALGTLEGYYEFGKDWVEIFDDMFGKKEKKK
jgi:hypothetical protein